MVSTTRPDPSSQAICSIGGNVAENSGGAHCLKYGFTMHHVTGLEIVTAGGEVVELGGGKAPAPPGYDLLGAFIGSEGTLGIVDPRHRATAAPSRGGEHPAGGLRDHRQAGEAVSAIIASGSCPRRSR